MGEQRVAPGLTLAPEIERLRALLREIGSDNPGERDRATAEAVGMARVVSVIVRAVEVEAAMRVGAPDDETGHYQELIARALAAMNAAEKARMKAP